jgi:transglutaminase-like putative cysteine protease
MQNCLQPTYYLDCDHPGIKSAVQDITRNCENQVEALQKVFFFVRDQIPYNMYAVSGNPIHYKASKILEMGTGFCLQKAILFTAMGRAAGIPGRLVLVAIRNHLTPPDVVNILGGNVFFPHAYSQFYIENRWVNVAATYDRPLCERIGAAVPEFDGRSDTLLPATDLKGRKFIEYIEHYGTFDDLPWQLIVDKLPEYYGSSMEAWFGDEPAYISYKRSGSGIG